MVEQGEKQSVDRWTLHKLFDLIFGEADGQAVEADDARIAAVLSAHLEETHDAQPEDIPEALIAAYLDGGLDDAGQKDVHALLSRSPTAFQEVASADAFLASIDSGRTQAPTDLVKTSLSHGPAPKSNPQPLRCSFATWTWSGLALAMVAAAIAAVVFLNRQAPPSDGRTPIIAKTAPVTPNPAVPPVNEPAVAGKTPPASEMVPVASPEPAPSPTARLAKPTMAPEGLDTMPAPRH